jgi:hypothetical protein
MKRAFEMDSGAMKYVHMKLHRDWFRHLDVVKADTHTKKDEFVSLLLFFHEKKVGQQPNLDSLIVRYRVSSIL